MTERVAVIGGGIGGLSAALDLRSRGYAVDVYEKNGFLGGKAGCEERDGFVFDTGPSLLTMPSVFDNLLAKAGRSLASHLPVLKLETICKYFFSDGTVLNAFSDRTRLCEECAAKTTDSAASISRYLDHCRVIYENAADIFLFDTLDKMPDLFRTDPLRGLRIMAHLDIFGTFHGSHRKFFTDPRTIQLFDRYATYAGSDPYKLPATFNIIPHVEYGIGAFAPQRGIRAIPRALEEACRASGVRIFTESRVERILTEGARVRGIASPAGERDYDVVVSNADAATTYRDLLCDERSPMAVRYRRAEPSSSAIVFYWGMGQAFPELEANNIFFSSDYRTEFRQIFDKGICPDEPTVYVNISSKYCPADAPPGCENWFVLVNVPYDHGQDWQAETARVRARTVRIVSKRLGCDVARLVRTESVMTPADIYRKTLSNRGSIYGISSNNRLAAYYRQPNRSKEYENLYFAGGSAHPGGGMPLVALSGMTAADLVAAGDRAGGEG